MTFKGLVWPLAAAVTYKAHHTNAWWRGDRPTLPIGCKLNPLTTAVLRSRAAVSIVPGAVPGSANSRQLLSGQHVEHPLRTERGLESHHPDRGVGDLSNQGRSRSYLVGTKDFQGLLRLSRRHEGYEPALVGQVQRIQAQDFARAASRPRAPAPPILMAMEHVRRSRQFRPATWPGRRA